MLLESTNVDLSYNDQFDLPCLVFTFKGKFTQLASEESTQVWKEVFDKSNSKHILVWDCSQMTGFEMSARREWLKYMQLLSNRIDRVLVISDSVLIRGSARLMLKLFNFRSEIYSNQREVWDKYPAFI